MNDVMENLIKQAQQVDPTAFKSLNDSRGMSLAFEERNKRFNMKFTTRIDNQASPKWLLPNVVLENGITVLYAQPGVGKSFFAIDALMQVSLKHPAVYVASEGQLSIGKRFRAWTDYHQNDSGKSYFIGETLYLLDDESIEEFISTCKPAGIKLVVIDTLSTALVGGDENSSKDMSRVVENLKRIRNELNAAILLVHHTGKSGVSERGSSVLRGGADIMVELVERDEAIEVICSKMKDHEEFERHFIKLHVVTLDRPPDNMGKPITSCVVVPTTKHTRGSGLSKAQREVLDLLALGIFRQAGARASQLSDALSMSRSNFYQVLSSLKQKKLIEQSSKGDPYTITAKGLEVLGVVEEAIDNPEQNINLVQVQMQSIRTDQTTAPSSKSSLV